MLLGISNSMNPSIKSTRQMRTQVDTTQRKNKSKQSTKYQVKTLCKEGHSLSGVVDNPTHDVHLQFALLSTKTKDIY
jgi:hypothetical protein